MPFRTDTLAATVRESLAKATDRRARADGSSCIYALNIAWEAATELADPHLVATCSWRLAKAHHDFGDPEGMVEAVRPLFCAPLTERANLFMAPQAVGPFDHYPNSARAAERLSNHYTDRAGYGEPLIREILTSLAQHHADSGDPVLAARARVSLAWWHGCRGEATELWSILNSYLRLSPDGFAADACEGAHRHPKASSIATSLFHVQRDLARSALRSATWTGDVRRAHTAMQLMEDATEDVGITSPWVVDAACHAAWRFDWEAIASQYQPRWGLTLSPDKHPVHAQLIEAITAQNASRAVEAGREALRSHRGPEWAAAAFQIAFKLGDRHDHLSPVVQRYGVTAFCAPGGPDPKASR